jgi:hypothetical protein
MVYHRCALNVTRYEVVVQEDHVAQYLANRYARPSLLAVALAFLPSSLTFPTTPPPSRSPSSYLARRCRCRDSCGRHLRAFAEQGWLTLLVKGARPARLTYSYAPPPHHSPR